MSYEDLVSHWSRELAAIDPAQVEGSLASAGVEVVRLGESRYPSRLLRSPHPPELLYVRGDLSLLDGVSVGIVGTRRATHYGLSVAHDLAGDLAGRGVSIVSGLAAGIDGAAHEAVLARASQGGGPVAVVGGGIDVIYPQRHRRLFGRVAENGVLLSEAPLGAAPQPWRFPQRNRIIAALSDVVVIVESPRQGGSMHTAEAANVIGVPLFAVPGSIRSPQSEGTNRLIADGALLLQDVDDILVALGRVNEGSGRPTLFATRAERIAPADRLSDLSALARGVYELLCDDVVHVDDLCDRLRAELGEVVMALEELDEVGAARRRGGGWLRG